MVADVDGDTGSCVADVAVVGDNEGEVKKVMDICPLAPQVQEHVHVFCLGKLARSRASSVLGMLDTICALPVDLIAAFRGCDSAIGVWLTENNWDGFSLWLSITIAGFQGNKPASLNPAWPSSGLVDCSHADLNTPANVALLTISPGFSS